MRARLGSKGRMSLLVALVGIAAAVPFGAWAEEDDVPTTVISGVVDSHTLAFQNPFTGATLEIPLPRIEIPIGSYVLDLSITLHLVVMWVAALLLILIGILAAKRRKMVPSGFYSMIEVIVSFVRDELAIKNIGKEEADRYVPFLCTAFFFIFIMNLLGLVPYSATATGNLSVTAGLALTTLAMMLYAGMRSQGVLGFWVGLVPQGVPLWLYPVMIPVEILGLLTKPFALAVRLFANMAAGGIVIGFLIGLIFLLGQGIAPAIAPVSVAFATGMFLLKLFVALLQAYIFTMLSALFIGMSSNPH